MAKKQKISKEAKNLSEVLVVGGEYTIDVEGKEEQCVYVCFDSNENACVFRVGENKYAFLPNDPVEKHVVKKKKRK